MDAEGEKYRAAAEACKAAGLPQPGVHLRYPTGLAKGRTPAIESVVDGLFGNSAFVYQSKHPLLHAWWHRGVLAVSAYIPGLPAVSGERTWASRGLPLMDAAIDAQTKYLGRIWPGMDFVAVDASGVAEVNSYAEYMVIRMQRLGVPVALEPVREGTWANRPPLPVFLESRVFANHSRHASARALFRRLMQAPRIIIMDVGGMSRDEMVKRFANPKIEYVLPPEGFDPDFLAKLAIAGGGK
jgi:hypothetical protein